MPPNGVRDKGRDRAASGGTFHDSPVPNQIPQQFRDTCGKCGATRVDRQIGLEATPDEYLATMVAVFREVRRVLRPDGTCWVNIGDSYASGEIGRHDGYNPTGHSNKPFGPREQRTRTTKPKDLLLMPARLALALQADGWWVRSAIVWSKPNPMPESVSDRPTSAYEMVYLLTRSARYYYDADAVRESVSGNAHAHGSGMGVKVELSGAEQTAANASMYSAIRNATRDDLPSSRNLRNVWTLATESFPGSHFATYPTALASRCIRAGTSERGCCSACGAPWRRVVERQTVRQLADAQGTWAERPAAAAYGDAAMTTQRRDATSGLSASNSHNASTPQSPSVTTTGWSPSCPHDAGVVPATVLDPFFGAGTTGLVADRLGRDCIGIDLNPDYNAMSRARIEADAPLFAQFPVTDPADERMADLFATAAD